MIIAEIFAGLGNQMFQYAAARALAERLQTPLKLNISGYEKNILYPFDLNKFNITATAASKKEIGQAVSLPDNPLIRNWLLLSEKFKAESFKRAIVREKHFHFTNELANATRNTYVFGHWQSEKYFKEYENIIRKEFTLREDIEDRIELIQQIQQSNSVSLTIRRGDYLQHPDLNLYGDKLTYHYQAVNFITEKITQPHFFVFSDDIEWVKNNLQIAHRTTYVSEIHPGEAYKLNPKRHQDLLLMSTCKHHIITNSTFAWWGAWLSIYPSKIVIAPSQWFGDSFILFGEHPNTKDILPDTWIRL